MGDRALRDYVRFCHDSTREEDGNKFAECFKLEYSPGLSSACAALDVSSLEGSVRSLVPPHSAFMEQLGSLLTFQLSCLGTIERGEIRKAFEASTGALKTLDPMLKESATNFLIEPIRVVIRNTLELHQSCSKLEEGTIKLPGSADTDMVEIQPTLNNMYGSCSTHRISDPDQVGGSKAWGVLIIVNPIFKIFLRKDKTSFMKKMMMGTEQMFEKKTYLKIEDFPASQAVTYQYYQTVVALYDDKLFRAEKYCTAALSRCHEDSRLNRRLLMIQLVPLRIFVKGRLPKESLLVAHKLENVYSPLVTAVKEGNITLWNETLSLHRSWYLERGVYMLLERISFYVYRRVIKRACALIIKKTERTQIKLPLLLACLQATGAAEMDMDELECILANLIHRKLVKGYLSHDPPTLVLHKTEGFRPLHTVLDESGPVGRGPEVVDL